MLLRHLGYKITPIREAGEDPLVDMARFVGSKPMIFDVGANIGQSAKKFRAAFLTLRAIRLNPVRPLLRPSKPCLSFSGIPVFIYGNWLWARRAESWSFGKTSKA